LDFAVAAVGFFCGLIDVCIVRRAYLYVLLWTCRIAFIYAVAMCLWCCLALF